MSPAETLAAYIVAVCTPLLDQGHQLQVEHAPGAFEETVYRVRVPSSQMGFMLGRGGENAEAVRRLARARARVIGFSGRVDVRIVTV